MCLQNQTFNIPQHSCFLFTPAYFINQTTAGKQKFTDEQAKAFSSSCHFCPTTILYILIKNHHSINIQFLIHCMCELKIIQFVHGSHFIWQLLLFFHCLILKFRFPRNFQSYSYHMLVTWHNNTDFFSHSQIKKRSDQNATICFFMP